MEPVRGIGGAGGKRLLQKVDADAFSAAHLVERRWPPGFALDHIGKQGQSHGHHLAVLSKSQSDR